ncbi:MAG: ABC transporter ATP-binding protein [Candidatus Altiarchaeota archaeon]
MPSIELKNVGKRYGDYAAVSDVNLKVADGEYVTLLGPSGCGKTTLLRMIAGLAEPSEGDILIDGRSVSGVPPHDRRIGYLFQNYALFPHLDVEGNIGFGPLMRGDFKSAIDKTTSEMLRMIRLLEWAGYMPNQLSGGMQQRVALARSLAVGFKILLLDEPMSSLDPKIALKLRYELQKTAKTLGLTVIHVTHDQADAMSVSDRIIVMRRGAVAQVGSPKEIYYLPSSPFVAHFIGESNFLKAQAAGLNLISVSGLQISVQEDVAGRKDIVAAVRPEAILFEHRLENSFEGIVKDVRFLGPTTRFEVDVCGITFTVSTAKHPELRRGSRVKIYLPPGEITLFHGVADLEKELRVL